jgi:hypothetical protein
MSLLWFCWQFWNVHGWYNKLDCHYQRLLLHYICQCSIISHVDILIDFGGDVVVVVVVVDDDYHHYE